MKQSESDHNIAILRQIGGNSISHKIPSKVFVRHCYIQLLEYPIPRAAARPSQKPLHGDTEIGIIDPLVSKE